MNGKLYLIPTPLAEGTQADVLPPMLKTTVGCLTYFLCEDVRTARRFVSSLKVVPSVEALRFEKLDKDTSESELPELMAPIHKGIDIGVMSEAGCPGVADPGALAVAYAQEKGIAVVPLVGPSSLLLALMASGLNGQRFAFQGYLPIDAKEATTAIQVFERESASKGQTQIFIETPHRNNRTLDLLLKTLKPTTQLCLAVNLTAPEASVLTKTVSEWRQEKQKLEKVPVTFLFQVG
jgi:16S rRNA (cytidine1402-2'-O)-methyltransferase